MMIFMVLFLLVSAYLIGSICSAVIVCQLNGLPDPRSQGSNNPGATNVMRIAGKKYAAIVLIVDMLKGLIPVLLGHLFGLNEIILGYVALAAVLGHIFPIFFDFKGGKGVATALGALFGLNGLLGLATIITWAMIAKYTRYVSLASMIALGLAPWYALYFMAHHWVMVPLFFIAGLVIFKHSENIQRLINGKESKL